MGLGGWKSAHDTGMTAFPAAAEQELGILFSSLVKTNGRKILLKNAQLNLTNQYWCLYLYQIGLHFLTPCLNQYGCVEHTCKKMGILKKRMQSTDSGKSVFTPAGSAHLRPLKSKKNVATTDVVEEPPTKGTFKHLKKKNKLFYYEEVLKQPDPFFHVDVGAKCKRQKVQFKEKKAEHFAFVVDLDAYEYHKVVFHTFLNEILQSAYFRSVILFLVMLNAIMIGIATFGITDDPTYGLLFRVVDQIVLSVFIFEILLKWLYDFRLFWKVPWRSLTISLCLIPTRFKAYYIPISL